jgi:hypothetical protein
MAPAGARRSKEWATTEMIARPLTGTRPAGKPSTASTSSAPADTRPAGSQPSTRPAVPNMSASDLELMEEFLAVDSTRRPLGEIAKRHQMLDKTVKVDIEMTSSGKVSRFTIQLPKSEKTRFQGDLGLAIREWRVPGLKKAGRCTVELRFVDPDTLGGWGTHIFEMAPPKLP